MWAPHQKQLKTKNGIPKATTQKQMKIRNDFIRFTVYTRICDKNGDANFLYLSKPRINA